MFNLKMFNMKKKITKETLKEPKKEIIYCLKIYFEGGDSEIFEFANEQVRTELINRLQRAIRDNKEITFQDKEKKEFQLFQPRRIIYLMPFKVEQIDISSENITF